MKSGQLPRSFYIEGVDLGPETERHAYASGGFGDVYQGIYAGRTVAAKKLRIDRENTAKMQLVSLINRKAVNLLTCLMIHVGVPSRSPLVEAAQTPIHPAALGCRQTHLWSS
jgi:hypothetical protein